MALGKYGFKDIICLVNFVTFTNFAPGDDVVMVDKVEDDLKLEIGASGTGVASFIADDSHKVTLKLQSTAPENSILYGLYQTQLQLRTPFPFLLKDAGGTDIYQTDTMMILKKPNTQYGAKAGVFEWSLITDTLQSFIGGHS